MTAYIVAEIEVTDAVAYEEYRRQAPPSIAQYGGKYIVRGGHTETLEGEWLPKRIVILEFPSFEQAKKWWASPEYAAAKQLRHRSARTKMIVVDGIQ
jgi:uncharacterized protein (DUF1330 family)